MGLSKQQGSAATTREEFRHGVQILDGITSWHLWSSGIMILLPPGMIILLSFPSLGPGATLLVRGLLGLIWIGGALALYRQWGHLKLLRQDLIAQTDAATKQRVKGEQYYGLSILDPLTGLYNRRFGETRLQEEIKRAEESDDPLLVLAFDFDRFKQINDNYGHAAGDLALKEFSRRLQRAVRACDVPTRIGGDEFFVILPDCPPEKFEMILSRMGSIKVTHEGNQIPVGFSFGLAQYEPNDTPETLIKRADERLYAAKEKRKHGERTDQASAKQPPACTGNSDVPAPPQQPVRMPLERVRRSARIPRKLAIFLIGNDLDGKGFLEQTNTIDLSQRGARIVSRHKLAPEQEIIVRRHDTSKEAEARIVRVIDSRSDSYTYGAALVSPDTHLWSAECPQPAESKNETIPSLFECGGCKRRESAGDSEHGSAGHAVSEIVQSCKRCRSTTTWKRIVSDEIQHECHVDA
jgi:diguanylate cyclase (GGDEF)-like protein